MHPHQLLANLSLVTEQLWQTSLGDTDLHSLKKMAAKLSSEVEVYETLTTTTRWLCEPNKKKEGYQKLCTAHKNRITKVLKDVHGDSQETDARIQALRQLDMKTLMFIGASYTVLGIKKMSQKTFECLIKVTPNYISITSLPSEWILREEFRVAVTQSAKLGGSFKRSRHTHFVEYQDYLPIQEYHELEFEGTAKRLCTGALRPLALECLSNVVILPRHK